MDVFNWRPGIGFKISMNPGFLIPHMGAQKYFACMPMDAEIELISLILEFIPASLNLTLPSSRILM